MSISPTCPLCAGSVDGGVMVRVCHGCHESLQMSGAYPVSSTGEFSAVPASDAARILGTQFPTGDEDAEASCTWCGKAMGTVKRLISRGDAHICNECVSLCVDILSVEMGDDWR